MNITSHRIIAAACLLALTGVTACGDDGASSSGPATTAPAIDAVIDPGDGGDYRPGLSADDVVAVVDNPYFPLPVGARWVYEGTEDGDTERIEVEVLAERRTVMGIEVVVVRDRGFVNGELAEDTLDFFAQDTEGNVWYLGEETAEYEGGEITSTEGSFAAGVDGALPGIIMPAHPAVGDAYRQEYYPGDAEDMGEILSLGGTETTPAGRFEAVVSTRDWTPLEPEVIEEKQYAPGVGFIVAETVAGGDGRVELIEFDPGP